jgi:hypothetical protein
MSDPKFKFGDNRATEALCLSPLPPAGSPRNVRHDVSLKLEIDAEVRSGLDRSKVRTFLENANTLGFIDKVVK